MEMGLSLLSTFPIMQLDRDLLHTCDMCLSNHLFELTMPLQEYRKHFRSVSELLSVNVSNKDA